MSSCRSRCHGICESEKREERTRGIMFKRSAGWNTEKIGSVSWTKPVAKKTRFIRYETDGLPLSLEPKRTLSLNLTCGRSENDLSCRRLTNPREVVERLGVAASSRRFAFSHLLRLSRRGQVKGRNADLPSIAVTEFNICRVAVDLYSTAALVLNGTTPFSDSTKKCEAGRPLFGRTLPYTVPRITCS